MDGEAFLHGVELLVGLLAIAVLVAFAARIVRLPDTVALVIAGLLVGGLASALGVAQVDVPSELVLVVLLPGLVFEAAYRLDLAILRRWALGLATLAVPGVLISAAVVAVVLHLGAGLALPIAFVAGAIVSATDPAAVVATFKRLPVPNQLATLVDGESLLNDGTGLVLFSIALAGLSTAFGPIEASGSFLGALLLSGVIGLAAGLLAAALVRAVDDPHLELLISVVLAYGSYLIADALGVSGVLATVTAAVILGNVGGRVLTPAGSDAIDTVWGFIAYLLTAVVFLLIGMAIPPERLLASIGPIAWAIVGILIGRAIIIYGLLGGLTRAAPPHGLEERVPIGWLHVLFWSGLRGAVAVAMALSLPPDVPQRDLLQEVTFGVVLFTLLVQGTTVGWLVKRSVAAPRSATAE